MGWFVILEFLNQLTQSGYRIFSKEDARKVVHALGLKDTSVNYILKALIARKAIRPLFKGNYIIEDNILSGAPLHKFEIAMHLAKGGAVCCWSAMAYHELTDQVLSIVYVYTPQAKGKSRSVYQYKVEGYDFFLIQTNPENLWGIERRAVGETKVYITDLERTLIDGLMRPQYCGGFREVLSAFEIAKDRMEVEKLVEYGKRCPHVIQKRLGWILERLPVATSVSLEIAATSYYDKLDPAAPRRGKYNKKWMLVENF